MARVEDVSRLINGSIGSALAVNGPRLRGPHQTQFRRYKRKLETLKGLLKAKYGKNAFVSKNSQDFLEQESEALFIECAEMQEDLISPMHEMVSSA